MRRVTFCRTLLAFLLSIALAAYAHAGNRAPIRVLFVGNSLTYVGNLPGVLEAISASNGKAVVTEMLVKGGATLNDRAKDSSVQALGLAHYDFVVFQERGGDVYCFGTGFQSPADCDSQRAHIELSHAALAHGATPVFLGTYQKLESASQALEAKERTLAEQIGAVYIPVSERFRRFQLQLPGGEWLNADKMHPGPDLVLLEAVCIYRAMFGSPPKAMELNVNKPIYGPEAHFDGSVPASAQQVAAQVKHHTYTKPRVTRIVQFAADERSAL